jgi:hypothetical protein
VLTFWVAYILTRPIGASFADFFGMPKDISGMGFGHGAVSIVTLILVVASIAYLSRSGIDQPEAAPPTAAAAPNYNQPGYNQPGYNQPGYNQPSYGQAQYYGDPQYADPRQGDLRQGADPGYRNPQYGDQRDYRY